MIFAIGFAAAIAAAALIFGFNQADPDVPKWTALHLIAVFSLAWICCQRRLEIPRSALLVIAFFAWCAFSLFWSSDWRGGAVELVNGSAFVSVFLIVALCDRDRLKVVYPTVACGACVAFVMALYWPEYFAGFGNENFQTEYALLMLPFLIWNWRYWVPLGLTLYVVFSSPSHLRWLALMSCGIVFVAYLWQQRCRWAAAIIAACGLNFALYKGIFSNSDLWSSVLARVEITTNTLAMWLNRPFNGNGIGSFNYLYPNYQEVHSHIFPGMGTIFANDLSHFVGAAHNEYAQVLADYGLIGFALIASAVWLALGASRDRLDWSAYGCLFMAGICSAVGFPLQNPHTGTLAAIALGIAANGRNVIEIRQWRLATGAMASVIVGFVSFVSVKTWMAQAHYSYTMGVLNADPIWGVVENINAYQEFGWPRHIRHQLLVSVGVAMGRDIQSIEIEPVAADKIFKISESAGGRATILEVARIEYLMNSGRALERYDEISERLEWLKSHAKLQNATWLIESKWAVMIDDLPRARYALSVAKSMPNRFEGYEEQIDSLIAAIE